MHFKHLSASKGCKDNNLVPRVLSLPRESTQGTAGHVTMHANPCRTEGGPSTWFAITVQGGECNAATQTLFSFEREASYLSEVLRLNLNFYESEMLIERDYAYISLFLK